MVQAIRCLENPRLAGEAADGIRTLDLLHGNETTEDHWRALHHSFWLHRAGRRRCERKIKTRPSSNRLTGSIVGLNPLMDAGRPPKLPLGPPHGQGAG